VIGGTAAAALVVVRTQRRSKKQGGQPLRALNAVSRDVSRDIRKRLGR
jgi:hypothetical protein